MKRLVIGLVLLGVSFPAAAWQLDNDRSSLYYVSIKKNTVAELNTFGKLSGKLGKEEASLVIHLESVATDVDIRDKRMREKFFEVDNFPEAVVKVAYPRAKVADLAVGETRAIDPGATLSLHDSKQELDAPLTVTRLKDDTLQVSNVAPVLVQAGDFGLANSVEELREIAGLPSISPVVPVSFTLYFVQS